MTVGTKARLRFHSCVSELVAQLNGYETHFRSEANCRWAMDNCGVEVRDPRLIGVVGNYDNLIREEVDLVLEQDRDCMGILSYQDIIDLLRRKTGLTE